MKRPSNIVRLVTLAATVLSTFAVTLAVAAEPNLAFHASEKPGEFAFDTGKLRGTLRLTGNAQGLAEVVHVPTGVKVTHEHYGLLAPYRLFSAGKRYGDGVRAWPCEATLNDEGQVEAAWSHPKYPATVIGVYRLTAADTIDCQLTIAPTEDMPDCELFLSSYFANGFDASVYLAPTKYGKGPARFYPAGFTPWIEGTYLMFPRDAAAVGRVLDGRWRQPPHPVTWTIGRDYAAPLVLRRNADADLTVVQMANPGDCFAVATPYDRTPPDGVAAHRSLYFSLFGSDVPRDKPATAHTRTVIRQKLTDEAAAELYRDYDARRDQ